MQERHINRQKYFDEQVYTTQKYVVPFVGEFLKINSGINVLEIGCGEAGNLQPFLDLGCNVTGIDLSEGKIENGKAFYANHPNKKNLTLIAQDIYKIGDEFNQHFDLIIMRDTIEHIPDQEVFMGFVKKFLKPDGLFFLGFPPWQSPFGGHQQVCSNKFLSVLPYFHLLPDFLYVGILKLFGESAATIQGLMEIKATGISIERFKRIIKKENYTVNKVINYFINPNYEIKFKLQPRKQLGLLSSIPVLRNFTITACYYLISFKKK